MRKHIERFSGLVKGSINGFDRIVFKGFILPLMSAFWSCIYRRSIENGGIISVRMDVSAQHITGLQAVCSPIVQENLPVSG